MQAKAIEDALVGLAHGLVADLRAVAVFVEGIRILHDELAATHQTKAGAAFVAELGLDLVDVLGQLLVALELLAGDIGHHFFGSRLHDEVAAMAVLNAQQLRTHLLKAAGFLPQLSRLHHRHGDFNGTGTVHFFAHDGLDLADHAQTHGHVVVDASTQLFDHASPRHELVADHFGIGRSFFEGGDEKLGCFHGGKLGGIKLRQFGWAHTAVHNERNI